MEHEPDFNKYCKACGESDEGYWQHRAEISRRSLQEFENRTTMGHLIDGLKGFIEFINWPNFTMAILIPLIVLVLGDPWYALGAFIIGCALAGST